MVSNVVSHFRRVRFNYIVLWSRMRHISSLFLRDNSDRSFT